MEPATYIAFLRAINVGGHTVKMERLRVLFAELDLANVATFIASGNVIFETDAAIPALERRIERHLAEQLGYAVATFIRSAAEVAAVASYQPFGAAEPAAGSTLYIGFLGAEPAAAARQRVLDLASASDSFHIHQRELYWLARTSISKSPISGARLEKALGMATTLRNSTTVKNIAARWGAS